MTVTQLNLGQKAVIIGGTPAKSVTANSAYLEKIPVPDLADVCRSSFDGDPRANITLHLLRRTNWHGWQQTLTKIEQRYRIR